MSKENTAKFLDHVGGDEGLKKKLLDSNAQAWVASAKSSGLDITVDELADELIGYIRRTTQGELSDGSLDAVSGGAGNVVARPVVAPAAGLNAAVRPVVSPAINKRAARW